jgi:prepilin-type N-terminal cleavage/methylation domain-containing protein
MHKSRAGFTLIEVMVAVMIVSVVIAALMQMRGNSSNLFLNIKKSANLNQYNSFLLSNDKYGFENSSLDMYRLVEEFDVESDLRRRLKSMKTNVKYEELKLIDTSEFDDINNSSSSSIVFEIGKTILKSDDFSSYLLRVRMQ